MRVLVCGGRHYSDSVTLFATLSAIHANTAMTWLIHGDASGADRLAALWAVTNKIPSRGFSAKWQKRTLTAIESVIPVSGILSGECVVVPKIDDRLLEMSHERADELLADEKELRFMLETTPEIRFRMARALLIDRAILAAKK